MALVRQLTVSYEAFLSAHLADSLVGRARKDGDDDEYDAELESAYRARLIDRHLVGRGSKSSLRVEVTG